MGKNRGRELICRLPARCCFGSGAAVQSLRDHYTNNHAEWLPALSRRSDNRGDDGRRGRKKLAITRRIYAKSHMIADVRAPPPASRMRKGGGAERDQQEEPADMWGCRRSAVKVYSERSIEHSSDLWWTNGRTADLNPGVKSYQQKTESYKIQS
ncbi:hypothetical protein OJAV_G00155910 [Oryzias javanicus]|uniref:Uncharacterized protein n=1 Tax=Oryzias javanicus TaxID=123683 RepID=A0A437CI40_ORYJA|nr:hypothetical protein OJAV_G00155910 [Oryzias javanicus]